MKVSLLRFVLGAAAHLPVFQTMTMLLWLNTFENPLWIRRALAAVFVLWWLAAFSDIIVSYRQAYLQKAQRVSSEKPMD
jgi:hypothetical protein